MKLKNRNWPHGLAGSRQFSTRSSPNDTKPSHHQRTCAPNDNHTQYHHLTPKSDSYNSITMVFSVTTCPSLSPPAPVQVCSTRAPPELHLSRFFRSCLEKGRESCGTPRASFLAIFGGRVPANSPGATLYTPVLRCPCWRNRVWVICATNEEPTQPLLGPGTRRIVETFQYLPGKTQRRTKKLLYKTASYSPAVVRPSSALCMNKYGMNMAWTYGMNVWHEKAWIYTCMVWHDWGKHERVWTLPWNGMKYIMHGFAWIRVAWNSMEYRYACIWHGICGMKQHEYIHRHEMAWNSICF